MSDRAAGKTAHDKKTFLVRIDPDLFREIERRADDDLRSVNREIEFLLRKAIARPDR